MSLLRLRGLRAARVRARRLPLVVETLEARNLLDAGVGSLIGTPGFDPSDVLVQLRPDFASTANFTLSGNESGSPSALAPGLWKIDLPANVTVADALATFRVDPRVDFVQPDYRIQVQTTPNDPYFTGGLQWGLNAINAPAAWNHTTGSGKVIVAVIDTGIDYTHPDLAGNVWTNRGNLANDGIGNDLHGANFTSLTATTGNVLDDNGHGSHVAGIIGAVGDNGIGVTGVNWQVQLMALKFLDANGSGYTSGAVRAIDYAIAHGASIINASWGGGGFDQALSDAIGRARQAGVIFVAAAGNGSSNNDVTPFYPASYSSDNVVTVAASNSSDQPASFTNYGQHTVDLYAPGVGIWSTVLNGGYASYSGTSMATPFVTGALALLKSEHPDWNYHQLITRLETTVDRLPQFSNVVWGGRLDVGAALANPAPPVRTAPPAVTGTIASRPSLGQFYRVRLIFNEAINPASFTTAGVTLTGPNGGIAINGAAAVAGSGNTQFDVTFATQTAPGTYRLTVGPHIRDTAGNEMASAFTRSFTVHGTLATFSSGPLNIPVLDFHTATSTINVGENATVGKITLTVNINHTWIGDLVIKLRGPDGTTVTLFNRHGGGGHNLHATFDDAAGLSIGAGRAPFHGSFRPDRPLSAFIGKNAQGAWQLMVSDRAAGDEGTLTSWSLTIQAGSAGQAARRSSLEDAPAPAMVKERATAIDRVFTGSLITFLIDAPADFQRAAQTESSETNTVSTATANPWMPSHPLVDRAFAADASGAEEDAITVAVADPTWAEVALDEGDAAAESW